MTPQVGSRLAVCHCHGLPWTGPTHPSQVGPSSLVRQPLPADSDVPVGYPPTPSLLPQGSLFTLPPTGLVDLILCFFPP